MPRLSVIVPCLNEAAVIASTLRRLRDAGDGEIVVVDGGSDDATVAVAGPLADIVIQASRGRAAQMNAGAAVAHGDILLFLHADTLLPSHFDDVVAEACADAAVAGGRFDVELVPSSPLLWLTGELMNRRSRLSGIATGDQAIFVRRAVFEKLGGYAALPLMEDIDFSRRLKRAGKIACLRQRVQTSSRRWRERGIARTILLMWSLRLLYFCGVSAERLRRLYDDVR
ncbi:MAG TPA: TIGR04283 family arsenosugar biosynthesis glycosyltransferase [Terriglobales bacterium]|nr:TIGR04283 family arsenosugar biosynthesis glycosyltransferase [Terriglobales bacterium]